MLFVVTTLEGKRPNGASFYAGLEAGV